MGTHIYIYFIIIMMTLIYSNITIDRAIIKNQKYNNLYC